jgi:hypothetical protein
VGSGQGAGDGQADADADADAAGPGRVRGGQLLQRHVLVREPCVGRPYRRTDEVGHVDGFAAQVQLALLGAGQRVDVVDEAA